MPGSDADLFGRMSAGDADAFDAVYDRHSAYVNGVCFHYLGNVAESEELLHEIFLDLWSGRVVFDPDRAAARTWLFCVAKNRCLDKLKRLERRIPHGPLSEDVEDNARISPERNAAQSEQRRRIMTAVSRLPDNQREAIEMCFFRATSYREAAELLALPEGTLKGRVRLAMSKLSVLLKSEGKLE